MILTAKFRLDLSTDRKRLFEKLDDEECDMKMMHIDGREEQEEHRWRYKKIAYQSRGHKWKRKHKAQTDRTFYKRSVKIFANAALSWIFNGFELNLSERKAQEEQSMQFASLLAELTEKLDWF